MRNLFLILSVLLNVGLLAFILLHGEDAPEAGDDSTTMIAEQPVADESHLGQDSSIRDAEIADADDTEASEARSRADAGEPEVAPASPEAEAEETRRRDWHDQAGREIRELVHDRLGDDAYLMDFGCEGSDCEGQVYFAGAQSATRVESLLDTINESDGALGIEAGRPALMTSFRPDPNGITANFVIEEGAELSEPTPEQILEAVRNYQE
jgi:hypothetical protein